MNSATANCSDSTLCKHSSSGCRGGSDTNETCAPGLTGPFCQLCEATNASELFYYVSASETSVAGCQPCGGLIGDFILPFALIAIGAAGVLLSLAALWRRLPKSIIAMLSRLRRAAKPRCGNRPSRACLSIRRTTGSLGNCFRSAMSCGSGPRAPFGRAG